MGLASIAATAAKALNISQIAASRLVAKHGREGLAQTLTALSDVLDGRRLPQSTLKKLPPDLLGALSRVVDKGIHADARPPLETPAGSTVFRTRPSPRSKADESRQPKKQEDVGEWSENVRTPQSSNVYSFRYMRPPGAKVGILEVAYKALNFHENSLARGSVKHRGKDTLEHQLTGILGGTVKGGARPDRMGVVYHYMGVPPGVFTSMRAAASRGKFVWSNLRIRGQIHGGQYPYSVVSGDLNLAAGGAYLPRKAVAASGGGTSFRTRSLAEIGSGKRGFLTSTLRTASNGTGFSTRPAPGRGR